MSSSTAINTEDKATKKLSKQSDIFNIIVAAILDKGGEHVVSIDLRQIPEAVSDYFIICEATSGPQIKAIADNVETKVKQSLKELPYEKEGFTSLQWVILDYVNIVVHIFHPEYRSFYDLEEMWSDALQEEHKEN